LYKYAGLHQYCRLLFIDNDIYKKLTDDE